MKGSLKIGSVLGIPIRLHITFLLIIPLFAFMIANSSDILGLPIGFVAVQDQVLRYTLGTIAALLLFGCVLVHEIAHCVVATRHRIKINDITLYLFGGVSAMDEVPRNPAVELVLAAAGPLTSLLIGILTGAVYFGVPGMRGSTTLGTMFSFLFYFNILLGVFNLIPAFPMDGGRVFRSLLAMRMPYITATRVAVFAGQMFAFFLAIAGMFTLAAGGVWLILVALFIYIAATQEEQATVTSILLEGIKVRDIMTKSVDTLEASASAAACLQLMFQKKHLGYPVLEGGKVAGVVTLSDVSRLPEAARDGTPVRDIMTRNVITLKPDDDAAVALQKVSQYKVGRLVVMDGDRLAGIVSRTDLVRAIELHSAIRHQ